MRIFLTILSLVFFALQANSQTNDEKVDSVFKFYFFIFKMETTNCCPPKKYPDYYSFLALEKTNDTVCLNKYAPEAVEFMQEISKIKPSPHSLSVNSKTVAKWKKWYAANKHKIKWDSEKNKPVLE